MLDDAMLRRNLLTEETVAGLRRTRGGRAAVAVRRSAELLRPGVDSPMETRLRLLLVLAGFPEPEVNKTVGPYVVDLRWEALRLGLEYDGRQHRDDLDQRDHDLLLARVHSAYVERGGGRVRMREDWRAHFPVRRHD